MTNFHNIILPDFISPYLVGGPNFDTTIIETVGGRESRYPNLNTALQKYVIKGCKLSLEELEEFNCFFRNCNGAAHGFLIKDCTDYKVVNQEMHPVDQNRQIFHLYKYYHFEDKTYSRRIYKPIVNSLKIRSGSTDIDATIDYENGVMSLSDAHITC